MGRKSCLKRCSFEQAEQELRDKPARRSRFDMISSFNVDGTVIHNRKSVEVDSIKENINDKADDSDGGSSYNIFGNNQLVISKEISTQLGLDKQQIKSKKGRANGGKSILKKGSLLSTDNKSLLEEKEPKEKSESKGEEA
ncbi:unnamed protein product [Sphagnum balticum]